MKSADPLDAFDRAIDEVIGRHVPMHLFYVVDLATSNSLKPAAGDIMMLSRALFVPGVEHAMQIIGVDMCFLVRRPKGSTVLQRSRIMNSP